MSTTGPVQKPALVTLAGSDVILRVWVQKTALSYATSPGRGGLRPSSPQCLSAQTAAYADAEASAVGGAGSSLSTTTTDGSVDSMLVSDPTLPA